MHILPVSSGSLDELAQPVDLGQSPADMVVLSFSDSDLSAVAEAWKRGGAALPDLRLAALRDLRHPMSVDLWIDSVAQHARIVLVRILGGYEWWRYGCDQLTALARAKGLRLALLPGECRERDDRLIEGSTLGAGTLDALLACFREGGPQNMDTLVRQLATLSRGGEIVAEAREVPRAGFYQPGSGMADRPRLVPARPVVPVIFYRSMLLAADTAPIDALCDALAARGIAAVPIFVASLKDEGSAAFVESAIADFGACAIVTATAFATGADPGAETLFDRAGLPVFQVVSATTRRDAWTANMRGLAPADLAMHVVMPELDGRILAGAVSFKEARDPGTATGLDVHASRPEPDRVEQVAARISAFLRLRHTARAERRIVVLMPDYPSAPGRSGYAVGLDVPASVLAMLHDLKEAGYHVDGIPESSKALLDRLDRRNATFEHRRYIELFAALPETSRNAICAAWGHPDGACIEGDRASGVAAELPSAVPAFRFRAAAFGNVTVAFAPDRGRDADRRADYHDPTLPPRHALVAFGLWMREILDGHAIVHVGAHGTLEWLPGKTVALSQDCFPEIVAGPLPVVYPFIVSNPGEAAQAKRRIAAVTLGHLPPPMAECGLGQAHRDLERLVDEYAQADGLDRRRRDRLAALIVETAARTGLSAEAGIGSSDAPDEALRRIDAWLCDLKDFAVRDGLHVYGRGSPGENDPARLGSAQAERGALLSALDGDHIRPGPSGAPGRGRTDVLPTGRNLFASDPRTLPTPTAFDLGRLAAEEVLRSYLQAHGDWPRSLVVDLWGSASLRTGGEEIAQGLFLMGCRPQWDPATGRVTGIEVLPQAVIGRPRIDVTWRISGLFRDLFPSQIALLDAAGRAVAACGEDDADNPLAAETLRTGTVPPRVFGSSPGTYGAGVEQILSGGTWQDRTEVGRAYIAAASHAYGGAQGDGEHAPEAFAERLRGADLLVHSGDDPTRDILDGSADVAFVGGFSAAVAALGGHADVIVLDTTDPARPRSRSVAQAVARVVRARAVSPRFIEGQMRHGPRGAAEFAETVDRLVEFAETTNAIPGTLIEAVHDAYVADARVRHFMLDQNPAAAREVARRLSDARRRGLWHPLRNAVDEDLAMMLAEADAMLEVA
jgi:cobaltochelatase CobN